MAPPNALCGAARGKKKVFKGDAGVDGDTI